MAIKAQYTAPMQVVETEDMRERIRVIAAAEDISQAQVFRELHEHGIAWREEISRERLAEL